MSHLPPDPATVTERPLKGVRIAVAGAGVFGLCAALLCAEAGGEVWLFDPAQDGANASGVAAGMIAPLGELIYDDLPADLWPLLLRARGAWDRLILRHPEIALFRRGCLYRFEEETAAEAVRRALALPGAGARPEGAFAVRTDLDVWLDPLAALQSLGAAFAAAGGRRIAALLPTEGLEPFDTVILCPGSGAGALAPLAPSLGRLRPVKGHVVRFQGAASGGPLERRPGLYLVPQPAGVIAGATMEHGRSDAVVDPAIVDALRRKAVAMRPALAQTPWVGAAGVRMAAPDGLPLVGPDPVGARLVAAGARRNGWLFGPLVAAILLAYLTGAPMSEDARRMSPSRFRALEA